MSTEFIHVMEFLQTITCFSILILIGQRFFMTWKGEDEKYLQHRVRELEEEIRWEREHQRQSAVQHQPQMQQPNNQPYQTQPIQQPNLRTSLTENQQDQTARKISQSNPSLQQNPYKRKSLTDLAKQQQATQPQQIQIKDYSESASERKQSIDSRQSQGKNRGITNELDRSNLMNENIRYPSLPQYNTDANQQQQYGRQNDLKLSIFTQIDTVFTEHLPILMSMLVLGILTESTYIFTVISLFGYVLTHLLLKLKQSVDQHVNQPNEQNFISKLSPLLSLLPKLWIFGLFINYWAAVQYST